MSKQNNDQRSDQHKLAESFPVSRTRATIMRIVQGGSLAPFTNGKKRRITDHGYKNLVFPKHETKQVRVFEENKTAKG